MQPQLADSSSESVRLAREDLAHRLGLPLESVTATSVIGQEFSREAFYCQATKERAPKEEPPADMAGFSIVLQAAGRRYEYHASGATIAFCRPLP